ncbi:MAG: PSD1 and planctomycete cytochrome C domain-containing protein [Acidobacteria bacterium]|nr:PSD1 and planctomycete cytochrome C domain-containing protein [Acidobacteriota bacterium]
MRSVLISFSGLVFTAAALQGAVSFNRDIRPIMSDTCFRCHGPDQSSRMAGIRLDIRAEALKPTKRGVIPIVPGKPDSSAIVARVFSTNAALLMPPKFSHKELSEAQKNTIRQWVAEGAVYEEHWSYQPVKRPAPPAGYRHPIDAFVRSRLAATGLTPSKEADPRTLLRRLHLDLTGLPPTPAEVADYLQKKNYEQVVDQLLASDRYAERQAMQWLDAVRYADTSGFHGDNAFPAWPYRDYVLEAIKSNKPFDQFTREQLAGDLLPGASRTTRVASAFNRMSRTSAEGGLQPKEYLAKYGADRVRTVAGIWMGATLGCAECHDHKFDPLKHKDFYAMKAFFADVKETGLVPDQGPTAWGELLPLPNPAQQAAWEALEKQIAATTEELDFKRKAINAEAWSASLKAATKDWAVQVPVAATASHGTVLKVYGNEPLLSVYESGGSMVSDSKPGNGLIVAEGPNPDNETFTITLKPGAGSWYSLGFEVHSDDRLPGARLARGSDRLLVTEIETWSGGQKVPTSTARSNAAFWEPGLTPWNLIDGKPDTGWGVVTYRSQRSNFVAIDFEQPLVTTADSVLKVIVRHDSQYRRAVAGRVRLALASTANAQPPKEGTRDLTIPALPPGPLDAAIVDATHPELAPVWRKLSMLKSDQTNLRAEIPQVVTTVADASPAQTRVLARGNFMDESGEVVLPAIPAFLGKLEVAKDQRATRLDLANWLVSPDNPLTSRTYVNRLWRQLFGTGLSKVLEDLGSQGEWPTHPELLDWLAAEFSSDWDMKRLVRVIVTSDTYKQSSTPTPEMAAKDPDNRLLARQSRFRVDAEIVRDVVLSASGLLAADKFGGPSVRPYQPLGYLAALNFPKRDYSESRGPDLYRRGLYSFWQRTFLHPSMAAFDGPSREECTLNRSASNTPVQSLVLLNDPSYVEAARVLAERLVASSDSIAKRIDLAFEQATSRRATAKERAVLANLYRTERARFRTAPPDAKALVATGEAPHQANARDLADLAATVSVARAILNLHEVITRN